MIDMVWRVTLNLIALRTVFVWSTIRKRQISRRFLLQENDSQIAFGLNDEVLNLGLSM